MMGMENKLLLSFENCDHTHESSHLEINQLQFFRSFTVSHVFEPFDHAHCSPLLSPAVSNQPCWLCFPHRMTLLIRVARPVVEAPFPAEGLPTLCGSLVFVTHLSRGSSHLVTALCFSSISGEHSKDPWFGGLQLDCLVCSRLDV